MQIHIVSGEKSVTGTIHFNSLGTSVPFNIGVNEVFTYNITDISQRQAVYNTTMGKSNTSIHITSSEPILVYAFITTARCEASQIFPVEVLGMNYYQISYYPPTLYDAYAVVAINNNTQRVRFDNNQTATIRGALKMDIPWIKLQNVKH